MITLTRGNLLDAGTEALVNTVNTVGVMGKGIALQFKRAFPENYTAYREAWKHGQLEPGRMMVYETGRIDPPRYIINFPTKRHWRSPARLADVERGLEALVDEIRRREIQSIAVPPLGCGHGGLRWEDVRPRIVAALATLEEVDVRVYEPAGAPAPGAMIERRKRPRLAPARAAFLELIALYRSLDYPCTLLVLQKLAYFLQESGQPLRLRFQQGLYGPYARTLDLALRDLEGHFIVGLGDEARPGAEIELLPKAREEARKTLSAQPEVRDRLARLASLIEGFETPYGMELLGSTHWVARTEPRARTSEEAAVRIRSWTERKAHLFRPEHVEVAWKRLAAQGWLALG